MPERLSHLVSVLFHQSVDSSLFGNFEFAQFLAEVESFVDSFLEGD